MKKMQVNPINIDKFYCILKSSNDYKQKTMEECDRRLQGSNLKEEVDILEQEKGEWRRVVPSPNPLYIFNGKSIVFS